MSSATTTTRSPVITAVPVPSRAPAVALVRGDAFVARRYPLPAGTPDAEVAAFVALQLEELSPFPIDQLYHGHVIAADRTAVFIYAAYRRRFSAADTERWPGAQFVLPEFAAALRMKFAHTTVVLLRSEATISALYFEANQEMPVRVASRPLAPDAPPDAVERARAMVRGLVEAGSAREVALRAKAAPEARAKGVQFFLEPDGSGAGREIFVPAADCWAMDVRDQVFLAEQRKRLGFDLVLWRIVLGTAAAVALLVFGEILFGASRAYVAWLRRITDEQAPVVQAIKERDLNTTRLEDFGRSGVRPFDMLRAVGGTMPGPVYATETTAKGGLKFQIKGIAPDVATVQQFEAALKVAANVQEVRIVSTNNRTDGTAFEIAITFRSGAFSRPAGVAAAASNLP